jgi:hypothetical protein
MPNKYTPTRCYYDGNKTIFNTDVFYIYDVEKTGIKIYSFFYNVMDILDSSLYHIIDASIFFSKELNSRDNQTSKKPFIENENKINLIRHKDVIDNIKKYKLIGREMADTDNAYLVPFGAYYVDNKSFPLVGVDPNINISIFVDNFISKDKFFPGKPNLNGFSVVYKLENLDYSTKHSLDHLFAFRRSDMVVLNTGFGGDTLSSYEDLTLIIPNTVSSFMSYVNFTNELYRLENKYSFYIEDQLKLKVSGPNSGVVGDILEYTVTLMNYDFSDTWINPPDVECYPSTDAGNLLHRKITLKNGVGKFKIDTSNLYFGETFDVKVGWKYITSDSKVSVTLS